MTTSPNPASIGPRFRQRLPVIPRRPRTDAVLPTGWSDDLAVPVTDRHFYLDTGIYHSLAGAMGVVGSVLEPELNGHEQNSAIRKEVLTQRDEPLYSQRLEILGRVGKISRRDCALPSNGVKIETIRGELIADAQLRHPDTAQTPARRDRHGGEAELIHLAELHSPTAAIVCNDAGASAVGRVHGVESVHFGHILRAAVRDAVVTVDQALNAANQGLSVSRLSNRERIRTCCAAWMRDSDRLQ